MKIPKRKEWETLDDWHKRLSDGDKNLYELLHAVSVEGYIAGTEAQKEISRRYRR